MKVPFPHSYENVPVRDALEALAAAPSMERFEELMRVAVQGGLVIDVTGSDSDSGAQARTVLSTDGRPVLPVFTSLSKLQDAVGAAGGSVQAVILPARQALGVIREAAGSEIVAVEFNPGTGSLVVTREHIDAALGD